MILTEIQKQHKEIMAEICKVIYDEDTPLCLKGGTSLLLAYGLDRFSEDLDFDITKNIESFLNIEGICKKAVANLNRKGMGVQLLSFSTPKKTDTTHKCKPIFLLNDGVTQIKIKIEVSRRNLPVKEKIIRLKNTKTYSPNDLAKMKLFAANQQDNPHPRFAARDLHDIIFLATQKERHLTNEVIGDMEVFLSDLTALAVAYEDSYNMDPLLAGRLYSDLEKAERWIESRNSPKGPKIK